MMSVFTRSLPPRGGLFLTLVTACLLGPLSAYGHGADSSEGGGKVVAVLDPLPSALSSLRVQLRKTLAPQLLVGNPTDKPLFVLDRAGRSFLRIGPDKTEGDLGAAAFHRSYTLMAPGAIPADSSGEPRWSVVEASPNWGWFDLRLRTSPVEVPHRVLDAARRANVGHWSIPVRWGDIDSAISGHFEYLPPATGIMQATVLDVGALQGLAMVRAMPGSGRPGLFVSYRGQQAATLMGEQGEPFLRFSPQGVEANRHSRTWARIAPAGAPGFVDGDDQSKALWATISRSQSFGWIEPRAAYAGAVENRARRNVVKRWQIPVRIGDRKSLITGQTEWFPVESVAGR